MLNKSNFIGIFSDKDESTGIIKERSIIIPIIQRDYAQGRKDEKATRSREKFLQALYAAVTEKPITLDFIYGDINEENVITLLDGQQRLTTLFLLYWYAAKKAGCDQSEYDFLKRFSYETRYSSRAFCADLVNYIPDFSKSISDDIEDQPWFTLGWKNDPTIKSMLTMIDAIDEKFKDIPNEEKPREKLVLYGSNNLSNEELLMKYTSQLEDAFLECQNCSACEGLESCKNSMKGY